MEPSIEAVSETVKKREDAHAEARQRLLSLFLNHAKEDTVVTKDSVASIVGTDYAMRRDVLAQLAKQNIFFFQAKGETKTTKRGDWRLASPERRFDRAWRGVGRVQRQANELAVLCQSAEADLDAAGRIEARAIYAGLNTAATVLKDESIDTLIDTANNRGDLGKAVAQIIGRPKYR